MEKVISNYTYETSFPLDSAALQHIANNRAIVEVIGNIAGDKVILFGCELNGNQRSEGYIFLRTKDYPQGEVLHYEGGSSSATQLNIKLRDYPVSTTVEGATKTYTKAHTERKLVDGAGDADKTYNWSDFSAVVTNAEIMEIGTAVIQRLNTLTAEPAGVVKLWAGNNVPTGYLLCDGKDYPTTGIGSDGVVSYATLFAAIGTTFNEGIKAYSNTKYITSANRFRVPDLRGRFVVGQDVTQESDYSTKGNGGGEEKHLLTANEMPAHSHGYEHTYTGQNVGQTICGVENDSPDTQIGNVTDTIQSTIAGNSQPHENRPPYYVLAYIIKAF